MLASRVDSSRFEGFLRELKVGMTRLEDRLIALETRVIRNEAASKAEFILLKVTVTNKISELESQVRDLAFQVASLEKRVMTLFSDLAKARELAQDAHDGVYIHRFTRGGLTKS